MIGQDLLGKGETPLEAANRALAASDPETAANRAYYAVYYADWAMLESVGVTRPKTPSGLIAKFSRIFVKTGDQVAVQPFRARPIGGRFSLAKRLRFTGHVNRSLSKMPRPL